MCSLPNIVTINTYKDDLSKALVNSNTKHQAQDSIHVLQVSEVSCSF